MTVEEARNLCKGDYVLYQGLRYKVLHTKEHRSASTNELYIIVKCSRMGGTYRFGNEFVELCKED